MRDRNTQKLHETPKQPPLEYIIGIPRVVRLSSGLFHRNLEAVGDDVQGAGQCEDVNSEGRLEGGADR